MYWTLAVRHLLVRPGRAAVLLIGYALGVGVMIVLLSVGDAMLSQSRDTSLVGGGELTALPHGVDVEAMRTGGLTGMFFSINGAHFVTRELIGGVRHRDIVAAVSPVLEQKLLTVRRGDSAWTVRGGADIPSRARHAGAGLRLLAGAWQDGQADSTWLAPSRQVLYDEIDRFHTPPLRDSTWAEWHYFNVVLSGDEWWYITMLVAGDLRSDRSGGQLLATHRAPDGSYQRFTVDVPRNAVELDTIRADLRVGTGSVTQRDGRYHVVGLLPGASFDFLLNAAPGQYFPPVELGDDHAASGYVVPALVATATGRLCAGSRCRSVNNVPAYHDHNWGSWRAVTWEWGEAQSARHSLLYGGVIPEGKASGTVPFFMALADSVGVEQIYRFDVVAQLGRRSVPGRPGVAAPDSLKIIASSGDDTLRMKILVDDIVASSSRAAGPDRIFLQMHGRWTVSGSARGAAVADSGTGFFETWVGTGPATFPADSRYISPSPTQRASRHVRHP